MLFGYIGELTRVSMGLLKNLKALLPRVRNYEHEQNTAEIAVMFMSELLVGHHPSQRSFRFEKDTVADHEVKADVGVPLLLDGVEYLLLIQVKSNKSDALRYDPQIGNGIKVGGTTIKKPGVFCCKEASVESLYSLSKFTGFAILPSLIEELETAKALRKVKGEFPMGLVQQKLFPKPWSDLFRLGVLYNKNLHIKIK